LPEPPLPVRQVTGRAEDHSPRRRSTWRRFTERGSRWRERGRERTVVCSRCRRRSSPAMRVAAMDDVSARGSRRVMGLRLELELCRVTEYTACAVACLYL
jgi:hypothetical protein